MQKCIILSGPTSVGKTALSIRLAKAVDGEIISADSMQVYRGMNIGTAKITKDEMENVPHHLIDIIDPDEEWSIYRFCSEGKKAISEITGRGRIPIIVGGTGFYIQALLYDVDFSVEEGGEEVRASLEALYKEKGAAYLHALLKETDPASAEIIHENNVKKVIRAIEYYKINGRPISEHNKEMHEKSSPYNFAYFVLNCDRETLYEKIDKRVDMMMECGLLDEVKDLKDKGYDADCISMKGLGYKEILEYLDGRASIAEAVNAIKQGTRHFAKRQITWFRREKDVIWLNREEFENEDMILSHILRILKEKGIYNG